MPREIIQMQVTAAFHSNLRSNSNYFVFKLSKLMTVNLIKQKENS